MLKHYWSVLGGVAVMAAALMMSPAVALAQHGGGHGGGGHGGGGGHSGGGGHGGGGHAAAFSHGGGGFGGHPGWGGGSWNHGGDFHHGDFHHGDFHHGDFHRGFGWGGWGWGWPWYGGWYGPGWGWGGYGWDYGYPYGSGYSYAPSYYGYDSSYPSDYSYGYAPDYSLDYSAPAYGYSDDRQPVPPVDNRAYFRVLVPADAQLWFENQPTTETGSVRIFNSPPLQPGHSYTYDVRAQWRQGSQTVTRHRQVEISPGDRISVDFRQPAAGPQPELNPPGNPKPAPRQTNPPPPPVPRTST